MKFNNDHSFELNRKLFNKVKVFGFIFFRLIIAISFIYKNTYDNLLDQKNIEKEKKTKIKKKLCGKSDHCVCIAR